jgi:hypothetical protein
MQPNTFSRELSDTHGILENNMVYSYDEKKSSGVFSVPSDWTVTVAYNVGMFAGSIVVESWLQEWEEADSAFIKKMQPTGTHFED